MLLDISGVDSRQGLYRDVSDMNRLMGKGSFDSILQAVRSLLLPFLKIQKPGLFLPSWNILSTTSDAAKVGIARDIGGMVFLR